MSIHSESIDEIKKFVKGFSADSLFDYKKTSEKFSSAYKQLHALLIWNLLLPKGEFPNERYDFHFEECVSDISQAFSLLTFSLFKPSRVMARSSIENAVRVIVADAGGDHKVKSVHSLFDIAKENLDDDIITKSLISNLKSIYGELCLTVHSAHKDHIALRIPFEEVFSYDSSQYEMTIDLLRRTSSAINQALYGRFSSKLSRIGHKNRDFLLDSLPKRLKRNVQA